MPLTPNRLAMVQINTITENKSQCVIMWCLNTDRRPCTKLHSLLEFDFALSLGGHKLLVPSIDLQFSCCRISFRFELATYGLVTSCIDIQDMACSVVTTSGDMLAIWWATNKELVLKLLLVLQFAEVALHIIIHLSWVHWLTNCPQVP